MRGVTRKPRSLTIVRRYQAPREVVFRAWTDPEQLRWFANLPPQTPTTVDLRVGGAWRLHMVIGDGYDYMTGGIYREIIAPQRLVFAWGAVDGWPRIDPTNLDKGPTATLSLVEADGVTEMTFTVEFADQISDDEVRAWFDKGIIDGWSEAIDRLRPHLAIATR
jgi:uncharacterized protein YndB with AHSA1/START domain